MVILQYYLRDLVLIYDKEYLYVNVVCLSINLYFE